MHNSEGDVKTMPAPNYIPLEVTFLIVYYLFYNSMPPPLSGLNWRSK